MQQGEVRRFSLREVEGLVAEVARGRITRQQFIVKGLALGLSAASVGTVLAACGSSGSTAEPSASASPTPMDTTMPDKLVFYNWSDSLDPALAKGFESQYGLKLVQPVYASNEELLAKLKSGITGYDVINPSDFMVTIMAKTGLLRPLDLSLLPNLKNAVPALQQPSFDPGTDGTKYSVPYGYGATAIAVRTDVITALVDSWSAMWEPAYKNNIAMFDGERECFSAALFLLGYSPNTTEAAQIEEAKHKLIEQKPLLRKYTGDPKRDVVNGMGLVQCWDGDVVLAKRTVGTEKVGWVLPKEGYMMFADGISICANSTRPYAAHLFLNYLMDSKVAAQEENWSGYQMACADPSLVEDPILKSMAMTTEQLAAGTFPVDLGEFASVVSDAWTQVKSA